MIAGLREKAVRLWSLTANTTQRRRKWKMTRRKKCSLSASPHSRIPRNKRSRLLNHSSSSRRKGGHPRAKAMLRGRRSRISRSTWPSRSTTARRSTQMKRRTRCMWGPHRHSSRNSSKCLSNSRRAGRQGVVPNRPQCRKSSKMTTMKRRMKMEVRRCRELIILLNTLGYKCRAR